MISFPVSITEQVFGKLWAAPVQGHHLSTETGSHRNPEGHLTLTALPWSYPLSWTVYQHPFESLFSHLFTLSPQTDSIKWGTIQLRCGLTSPPQWITKTAR